MINTFVESALNTLNINQTFQGIWKHVNRKSKILHIIVHFVKKSLSFHVELRSTWHFTQSKLQKTFPNCKEVFKCIDHYWTIKSSNHQNVHYNSAEDIHQYLSDLFKHKTKFYTILTSEDIKSFKNDNPPLIIKGCLKIHMLSFFPDGSIQSKTNICSCKSCIECGFVSCLREKGKTVQQVTEASDDDSTTESEF